MTASLVAFQAQARNAPISCAADRVGTASSRSRRGWPGRGFEHGAHPPRQHPVNGRERHRAPAGVDVAYHAGRCHLGLTGRIGRGVQIHRARGRGAVQGQRDDAFYPAGPAGRQPAARPRSPPARAAVPAARRPQLPAGGRTHTPRQQPIPPQCALPPLRARAPVHRRPARPRPGLLRPGCTLRRWHGRSHASQQPCVFHQACGEQAGTAAKPARSSHTPAVSTSRAMSKLMSSGAGAKPAAPAQFMVVSKRGAKPEGTSWAQCWRATAISCA